MAGMPIAAVVQPKPEGVPFWTMASEFVIDHAESERTGWTCHTPTGRQCWSIDGRVMGKREFIEATRRSGRPDLANHLEAFDESRLMTEHPVWPS